MWAAIIAGAKAFAATTAGKAVISGAISAGANRLLAPKMKKPRIDFQGLRNDAEAAGFNPLTALRSGAASGYMIPALSKQSFVGQFLSGAIKSGTDAFLNKDIDDYNKEIRGLELTQRKQNIKLTRANIASMGQDPYEGYGDTIPVQYLLKKFEMPTDMAKRAGIEPNANLAAGEIAEIFGEAAEVVTAASLQGQKLTFGTTHLGLLGGDKANAVIPPKITKKELPAANTGALSKELFEKIENAIMPKMVPFNAPMGSLRY